MLRPLTNTFGFETNCYVCDPANASGLRLDFYLDDERDVVTATARLGAEYSGAPTLVHGGVLAAICDDAMAWAAIALARRFALTAESRFRYAAPVPCGQELTVTARLVGRVDTQIWLIAEICGGETVLVRAEARATVIGDELAAGAGIRTAGDGIPL